MGMYVIFNNDEYLTHFYAGGRFTDEEVFEMAGFEKHLHFNFDDPDYEFDGLELWFDDLYVMHLDSSLVGYSYSDPEGEWYIFDVDPEDSVWIRNIQDGNLNLGQECAISLVEALYYLRRGMI